MPPEQSWKSDNLSISGSVLQILNFAYMHVNMFPKNYHAETLNSVNMNTFLKFTMQKPIQNVLCKCSHSEAQTNLDSLSMCCMCIVHCALCIKTTQFVLCIKCNKICIWIYLSVHLAKISFSWPMSSLRLLVSVLEIRNWT